MANMQICRVKAALAPFSSGPLILYNSVLKITQLSLRKYLYNVKEQKNFVIMRKFLELSILYLLFMNHWN
jgi:hypothetical protein